MALDFVAGCLGGVGGLVVGHPFDTVKVMMQTHGGKNPAFNSTINVFKTILKQNGIKNGIYAGLTSPLWGIAGINAIIFGTYANLKRTKIFDNMNMYTAHFMTGAISGLAQSPVGSITELLKIRFQIHNSTSSQIAMLKQIYQSEGLRRGIFKGFGITTLREIPSYGIYFASYEYFLTFETRGQPYHLVQLSLAGGFAGQLSWLLTYPIDVIKTGIQADTTNQYKGMIDCGKKLYGEGGIKVFYRGLTPTLIRAFPTNAVCFVLVDYTYRVFNFIESSRAALPSRTNDLRIQCDVQGNSLPC